MATLGRDKIVLASAFGVALVSTFAFGFLAWRDSQRQHATLEVVMSTAPYTPSATDAPTVKTDLWSPPTAQGRGRDWVYDTFTPPEIFYSARTRHFSVRPPLGLADDTPEEPFGLELAVVRPEPFRLQLIGYAGDEGEWRGTFQNVATGEVFLALAGRHVPSLALTIKSLDVRAADITLPQSMTTRQRVATAVIYDERTKREVTLTHRERQFTGGLSAFVAATGGAAIREVRQGETFKLGGASYRIEKITLAPPSVEITKESPSLTQPDRRTLTPRDADDLATLTDSPSS